MSSKRPTADWIILAPGIDFDPLPGLDNACRMPHAWQAKSLAKLMLLDANPDFAVDKENFRRAFSEL